MLMARPRLHGGVTYDYRAGVRSAVRHGYVPIFVVSDDHTASGPIQRVTPVLQHHIADAIASITCMQ